MVCSKDALHFLNIMMAAAPQQVTGTFLLPALQHYSHLLLPSQRSRSVKAGSLKSLLEVRSELCRILLSLMLKWHFAAGAHRLTLCVRMGVTCRSWRG